MLPLATISLLTGVDAAGVGSLRGRQQQQQGLLLGPSLSCLCRSRQV